MPKFATNKFQLMKNVLFSILILPAILLVSCNDSKQLIKNEWTVYSAALQHGDVTTAMNSLNRILAFDKYSGPALDTLAILYENSGSHGAAEIIALRALSVRESDGILKVLAKANKGLGKNDVALQNFSKLLEKDPKNLELLYEVAYANINLSKLSEAVPQIQAIITHPESGSKVIQEFIKEGSQMVPYKAVALNMLGFIQMKAQQPEDAKKSFEAALQIYPKYYLASNNLKILSTQTQTK